MSVPAAFLGVVLIWATTPLAIKWSSEGAGFLFGVASRMVLGVIVCLVLVGTASVFSRAWLGFTGLAIFGTAWAVLTVVLAQEGPGGSLLIPADAVSLTWVYGGAFVIGAAALIPRRVLGDTKAAVS